MVSLYFVLRVVQINLGHPLDQSEAKIKPITTSSSAFSRASENSVGFTLSSHRLFKILSSPLIGRCDYVAFGFTILS